MMSNKEAARWITALIDTMREETSRSNAFPDPEYKDEVYEALEIAVSMLSNDEAVPELIISESATEAIRNHNDAKIHDRCRDKEMEG